jgi:hypothetical protein
LGFVSFARKEGSYGGLHHNRDHAAFKTMAGDITDSESDSSVVGDDIIVIAADFSSSMKPEISSLAILRMSASRGSIICWRR